LGGGTLWVANHVSKGATGSDNCGLAFRTEKGEGEHEREWESVSRRLWLGSPPHCARSCHGNRSRDESATRRSSSEAGRPPTLPSPD
jgi:hypothetical protein